MDPLSTALRGVRVTGALLFNAEFSAPWGYAASLPRGAASLLAPGTDHLVFFHLVTDGEINVRVAGQEPARLGPGEIAVLPRGDAHELWNGPILRLDDGTKLLPKILGGSLDVERGGGGGAVTRMICGYFGCERYAERLFLAGLPPLFTVNVGADPAGRWLEGSIRHAVDEIAAGRAGRSAVLDRLTEALFLETFCRYADRLPAEQTGWLAAARDPAVGEALAAIHRDPARPWTLDDLAREAGTSRTVLVERFAHYLGESPQTYLARWRLQHAARLLETTDRTVLDVALEAGYASEASFNRAFKRRFDLPPARYRRRHRQESLAAQPALGSAPAAVEMAIDDPAQEPTSSSRSSPDMGARRAPGPPGPRSGSGGCRWPPRPRRPGGGQPLPPDRSARVRSGALGRASRRCAP